MSSWVLDELDRLRRLNAEMLEALDNLAANARLLKQCPQFDGCDICKAEAIIYKAKSQP